MQQARAYLEMARPINLLPSMMLVLFGAWVRTLVCDSCMLHELHDIRAMTDDVRPTKMSVTAQASTGRSLLSLRAPAVWLVSLLSSSVAAASMVVNDYFDFRSGVDTVNAPQKVSGNLLPYTILLCAWCACSLGKHVREGDRKSVSVLCFCLPQPLPSGLIPADGALLLSFLLYVGVLLATCFLVGGRCDWCIALLLQAWCPARSVLSTRQRQRCIQLDDLLICCMHISGPAAPAHGDRAERSRHAALHATAEAAYWH